MVSAGSSGCGSAGVGWVSDDRSKIEVRDWLLVGP